MVGSLDDRGFFTEPPEEIAARLEIPGELLEEALALLHTLDPPGIAARNLQDSLLLQLERLGLADSLEHRIVSKHLDALARKQYPQIARTMKVTVDNIARAADHIAALDPSPGAIFDGTRNPVISADARIVWDEGQWVAQSTNDNLPRLRIRKYAPICGTRFVMVVFSSGLSISDRTPSLPSPPKLSGTNPTSWKKAHVTCVR
jgi:RNA polymerase sigma-54 factor